MKLLEFEQLLKRTIGLDAATIGSSTVARAVRARMSACEVVDTRIYWELVGKSSGELQALAEAVVVAETWFFRDREAFAALARIANNEWLPNHPDEDMRLLSLPCASGEEPYSMAMALLDSAFPMSRFSIDAVDISAQAVTHARRGVYGRNSFRGVELEFRDRHFEATEHGHRVKDAVRRSVRFQHGNLLASGFLPGTEVYDIIFCRNLLIYFDRQTQDRAVQVLQRLLTADGVLFVGPSEAGLLLSHAFVPAKMPLAFAFRKAGALERTTARMSAHRMEEPAATRKKARPVAVPNRPPKFAVPVVAGGAPVAPPEPPTSFALGIEQASLLADQGRFVEAAKSCEEHLRTHGPSPEAFHLMSLIQAAAGNLTESAEYCRKTLYLDPNHTQSLVDLALLLEKQGDKAGAKIIGDRARRAANRKATQDGK